MKSNGLMGGLAGALFCLAIGYFSFTGREVPLLDGVDLGFHELGHLLTAGFGRFLHTIAGSVLQVAVPAGLALYFWVIRRDPIGLGVCAAWAGSSAYDVAIYVADAPYQRLPLIGGYHDWAYLLGPGELDALAASDTIANVIRFGGAVAIGAGLLATLYRPLQYWLEERRPQPAVPAKVREHRSWAVK